jgi:hypothetical protein
MRESVELREGKICVQLKPKFPRTGVWLFNTVVRDVEVDEASGREGTGRDKAMRAIAKQLDEAGIEYHVPIPPSDHKPNYGLSDSEFRKRVADHEFMMPLMQAALARGDISKVDEHLDYLLNATSSVSTWTAVQKPIDASGWLCCARMLQLWKRLNAGQKASQSKPRPYPQLHRPQLPQQARR